MNAVLLARLQFALTAGFHFLYPPTTLGLSLVILMVETLSLRGRREEYRELNAFLVKLLGALFVVGTATGITLEFAFGTNWAEYSRTVGNLFGPFLAAEGIFAFFLESVFLGVLLFGQPSLRQGTGGPLSSSFWDPTCRLSGYSWRTPGCRPQQVQDGGEDRRSGRLWEALFTSTLIGRPYLSASG